MKRNSVSKSGQRRIEAIIRQGERFVRLKFVAVDRAALSVCGPSDRRSRCGWWMGCGRYRMDRFAFTLEHRLFEQVFDLAIDATQFLLRPGFQFGPERRINPQQKRFAR